MSCWVERPLKKVVEEVQHVGLSVPCFEGMVALFNDDVAYWAAGLLPDGFERKQIGS